MLPTALELYASGTTTLLDLAVLECIKAVGTISKKDLRETLLEKHRIRLNPETLRSAVDRLCDSRRITARRTAGCTSTLLLSIP